MKKIRILILSDEVWNDNIHGNNVLTNWFSGIEADIANIYCSPGKPDNNVCSIYYQITDIMMLKSLISKQRAGKQVEVASETVIDSINSYEKENLKLYRFLKSINIEMMRVLRESIWTFGKYNINDLKQFIIDFNPDLIFCARKASLKILRLERVVKEIFDVPLIVFTGDDEYSLKQFRISPIFWIHRAYLRSKLVKNTKLYSLYYTHSEQQGNEYNIEFGINTKTLYKCADFSKEYLNKKSNRPIIIVYAGKLYCNRWKSLAKIAHYIGRVNNDEVKIVLNIYTRDSITKKQERILNDKRNSFICGPVDAAELKNIYEKSDIALHVESLDIKNKLLTRYSFSTKIIDCLNSSCAVMAICWSEHTGFKYLKSQDAAISIDNYKRLEYVLNKIISNPTIIDEYRKKAWNCGIMNHDREKVQKEILSDFIEVIENYHSN